MRRHEILRGKAPAEVILKAPGSGVYMFDWRQLKRWGFSESDLPPGSIVEYRIPTAWEQYRWRIVGSVAIIIAEFLLLADFPPGYDRLRQLLQDSHVASREALNEVRTVSYVLHPPILDGLGLVPALRWYLDGLQKRTAVSVNFETPVETTDLTPDGERALFRIVQESMNN